MQQNIYLKGVGCSHFSVNSQPLNELKRKIFSKNIYFLLVTGRIEHPRYLES
jgi:hypothetical protein